MVVAAVCVPACVCVCVCVCVLYSSGSCFENTGQCSKTSDWVHHQCISMDLPGHQVIFQLHASEANPVKRFIEIDDCFYAR